MKEAWLKSRADFVYYDYETETLPMEVRFDGDRIVLSYQDDGIPLVYEGRERGAGHYELVCPACGGRATLHRFAGSRKLEGYWEEDGSAALWRVHLDR